MAQQHINLGTAPAGSDGDTNRTAWTKTEANFNELYAELAARGFSVGRNLLINPQGRINVRNFAGGALAAGAYGYDRWKAGAGGCNFTVNATTGAWTHTSGPIVQVIEAPRIAGQVVTFSVVDPSAAVSVNVDGIVGAITAGSGRRSVILTVPSGSTGNVTLTITATGATYKDPQLELGSVATAFDFRHVALEQLMCQRYAWRTNANNANTIGDYNGAAIGTVAPNQLNVVNMNLRFPVQMRATPAISTYNPNDGATNSGRVSGITNATYSSVTVNRNSLHQVTLVSTLASGNDFILQVFAESEL